MSPCAFVTYISNILDLLLPLFFIRHLYYQCKIIHWKIISKFRHLGFRILSLNYHPLMPGGTNWSEDHAGEFWKGWRKIGNNHTYFFNILLRIRIKFVISILKKHRKKKKRRIVFSFYFKGTAQSFLLTFVGESCWCWRSYFWIWTSRAVHSPFSLFYQSPIRSGQKNFVKKKW